MKNASPPNQHGFTLVELMIVVAIVGVLAAIAGVAYVNYVKSAKITKLKQYAMEVSSGQEQYKSRNSSYLDLDGTPYASGNASWENLLGFNQTVPPEVTITTTAGSSSDQCPADYCGSATDFDSIWYAVAVEQDLDPGATENTTIYMYSGLPEPIITNEGK